MQMQPCVCQGRWWQAGREPARAGFEVLVVPCSRAPKLCASPVGSLTDGGAAALREPGAAVEKARQVAGSVSFLLPQIIPFRVLLPAARCGWRSKRLVLHPALLAHRAGVLQHSRPSPLALPCSMGSESALLAVAAWL